MTAIPGGPADKAGNRYERLWMVLRTLDLLEGKVRRIRWEPPGAVGTGVEWVLEEPSAVWVEQARDTTRRWTITRLINKGVLAAAKAHIDQGRRFRFLSSSSAEELDTLAYRAGKSESFAEYEEFLGEERRAHLDLVASGWGVSPEHSWSLLQQIETRSESVHSLERITEVGLRYWYADNADSVVGVLEHFCEEHMHEFLTAPQVLAHLDSKGFCRQLRAGDANVVDRLRQTRERHRERVRQFEPPGGLVPTGDVEAVVEMLRDPLGEQIVVVEGRAGFGKSTVAAATAATLEEDGWYVAAARMDVAEPMLTSHALGQAMGLTESPSVQLAVASDGQPALLVVDQLDAVSLFSGRVPDSFDAVNDILTEIVRYPNIKVLLACRSVDLENDQRLRSLRASERVNRHAVSELSIDAVRLHLAGSGIESPGSSLTIELLRTPLHLSLFARLSDEGRDRPYVTLQQLYARYTREARSRVVRSVGSLNWPQTVGAMVDFMSSEGVLFAPVAVLDGASQLEVEALESESVIVRHGEVVAFFHESYFDYLFAVSFVVAGRDLKAFLVGSDQDLFRRAQTRQVLEYLAATNRGRFISVAVNLLGSDEIRFHLKVVVVGVLRSFNADPGDWEALEAFAWSGSSVGARLLGLLSEPGWFDAVDRLGRWEMWLDDLQRADAALDAVARASIERPARASELLHPRIVDTEAWRSRLRSVIPWSLSSELVDLAAEVIESGLVDDPDHRMYRIPGVDPDFWTALQRLELDDPAGATRLIGAFLGRGLARARQDGHSDPFRSRHLASDSRSCEVITNVARKAPDGFVEHVLPFVVEVAMADQSHRDGELSRGFLWGDRLMSPLHGVPQIVFSATEDALRMLAEEEPLATMKALASLRAAESSELRFLACRTLTAMNDPDDAIDWIVSDPRNLALGWSDSEHWASRELIERHSSGCSDHLFGRLQSAVLDYWPSGGGQEHHGQYELLSALDNKRLSPAGRRRLQDLRDHFAGRPPRPPKPVDAIVVKSHDDMDDPERMSDDDWILALGRHTSVEPYWSDGHLFAVGARSMAKTLGARAKDDPERFSNLALRFNADIPAIAMNAVIRNIQDGVSVDVLTEVCEHAYSTYGSAAGHAICGAIGSAGAANSRLVALLGIYAQDTDPDHERARSWMKGPPFDRDLLTVGTNSTRGRAALSAASVLFTTADHLDALMPVVEALVEDEVFSVRACAAEAVTALLNHAPDHALELAECLFDDAISTLAARTAERLLFYAVVLDPDRFGPTLLEAIAGPADIAIPAGSIWAAARGRERLPASAPTDVRALPSAARSGAAGAFALNVADCLDDIHRLLDDDDPGVRSEVMNAIRQLDQIPSPDREDLIGTLMASDSSRTYILTLIKVFGEMSSETPSNAIDVCERAVGITGDDIAGLEKTASYFGREVTPVVLRLYREGDPKMRARCLDIIDRLAEFDVWGFEKTLQDER